MGLVYITAQLILAALYTLDCKDEGFSAPALKEAKVFLLPSSGRMRFNPFKQKGLLASSAPPP